MAVKFAAAAAALEDINGLSYHIREGEAWDANDPLVKLHPGYFTDEPQQVKRTVPTDEDFEARGLPVVEQATNVPGDARRRTTR